MEKLRDKISTQVPRVQLKTACQKILWGQLCFGIQYSENLRKANYDAFTVAGSRITRHNQT